MRAISPHFDVSGAGFVLLAAGNKFPPLEVAWQERPHTYQEATAHVAAGGNVGMLAGLGGLGGLDQDAPEAFAGLVLPRTLLWETRPGRLAMAFTWSDDRAAALASIGKRADLAQLHLYKDGEHVGEIKIWRSYQVVPPSWKQIDSQRVDYRLIESVPPAEISFRWLLGELQKLGISFSKNGTRLDETASRLEGMAREARQKRAESDEARSRRYAEAALAGEVEAVRSVPVGDRNNRLNIAACKLGGWVTAGVLTASEVESALALAAMDVGLDPSEIAATISSGLQAGMRSPREISEKGSLKAEEPKGPTVIDAIRKLAEVCDGASSKDGTGFSKFDREEHEDLIEKAQSEGYLSLKEERTTYRFLKKYKKQLKGLGLNYDDIGHITRDGEAADNSLAEINERIPEWIAEHHFKTVTDTERLYHYNHGVYLDDGETVLKALIETEFGDITSNRLVQDVVGKVKRRTYVDRDLFNDRPLLNVKNGLLDLESLERLPHTPDYLSTAQIDVIYDPTATAPKIEKFVLEVAQEKDVPLIWEIIGWLLWPEYNVHKAVMLLGVGRNGKGTLLRLITALLGKKGVSNVTLQDLVVDRFAKADLYGKLANIGGDLPSKDLSDTAAFRNLTGGDDNRAQEKYRVAFTFRNKAKLLFSANVLPRSSDDTYAFYSRWILIEFKKVFDVQKGTADPDLDSKLQTPDELSGLLNLALAGLARLRAAGWRFSYDKTVDDVERMYKRNANPVYAFLLDECEAGGATDYIEKTTFYNTFKEYAVKNNIRPLSSKKFTELLKDQSEIPVSTFRPRVDGDRPVCWQGVKFKMPTKSNGPTKKPVPENGIGEGRSRMSGVKPTPSFRQNGIEGEREGEKKEIGKIGLSGTPDILDRADQEERRKQTEGRARTPDTSCAFCGHSLDGGRVVGVDLPICANCASGWRNVKAIVKGKIAEGHQVSADAVRYEIESRGGRSPPPTNLERMIARARVEAAA